MLKKIKDLFRGGFFHIIGSTILNKIIAFITNIFLVRMLSKNDFGIFTGAFNIFHIVFLFSGLGITSGILYFCSKNISRESKVSYYRFSFTFGIVSEVFLCVTLILYGLFGNVGIEEMRKYIIMFAGLPFVAFVYDYFSIILRAEKKNRVYAKILNLNSALYAVFGVSGAFFGGITGTIIGRYLAYFVAALAGWRSCKDFINSLRKEVLSEFQIKDIVGYSLKAGVTSALNVILYRIDVAIIAVVVADASILASYKVGATLPDSAHFIPHCIMVYFLPLFIQNIGDEKWIKEKVKEVYIFSGLVCFLIGSIMIVFAPQIIALLWGNGYLDAVYCFRVLSVSFIILSTFRITSTNILLALKRPGYTLFISVITGVSNIVLDIMLTVRYGSIGAAYATLIVTVLASLLSFPYVLYIVYSGKVSYE